MYESKRTPEDVRFDFSIVASRFIIPIGNPAFASLQTLQSQPQNSGISMIWMLVTMKNIVSA
jgi:hypothetical protein